MYFRLHQLIYEAFHQAQANNNITIEEEKALFYGKHNEHHAWCDILDVIVAAPTLESIDWDAIQTIFESPSQMQVDGSMPERALNYNVGLNVVLLSLVTESNLLPYFDFWGVSGLSQSERTKIESFVGHLPQSKLCSLARGYEEQYPKSQKELSAHILRLFPNDCHENLCDNKIESVDATHKILWTENAIYHDPRYGAGYYYNHDVFDEEERVGAMKRIVPFRETVCAKIIPTSAPTGAPTVVPTGAPTVTSSMCSAAKTKRTCRSKKFKAKCFFVQRKCKARPACTDLSYKACAYALHRSVCHRNMCGSCQSKSIPKKRCSVNCAQYTVPGKKIATQRQCRRGVRRRASCQYDYESRQCVERK